jgi:hypothetical protein
MEFLSLSMVMATRLHIIGIKSKYDQASTGDVVVFNWDGCAGACPRRWDKM